jgi:hypothetical protein
MKLYAVTTIVKTYRGFKNVPFRWFFDEPRLGDRPYRKLIADYDPDDDNEFSEGAIDELFDLGEAQALKAYLDQKYGDAGVTSIEEEELPLPNGYWGWSMCMAGTLPFAGILELYYRPGCRCRKCWSNRQYPLPFKAAGYWDLERCERITRGKANSKPPAAPHA